MRKFFRNLVDFFRRVTSPWMKFFNLRPWFVSRKKGKATSRNTCSNTQCVPIVLVVGATSPLGSEIVEQARREGYGVRCLIRDVRRVVFALEVFRRIHNRASAPCYFSYGDLSVPKTIPCVLKNVSFVIDAATLTPADAYNVETVDWKGKIALIEAAELANIKKFIFFSILGAPPDLAVVLIELKLKVEDYLRRSTRFACTIFQCSGFLEGIIMQYALPILLGGTIWLLRNEDPIAYLALEDAAIPILREINRGFVKIAVCTRPGTRFSYDLKNDILIPQRIKTLALIGERFWSSEEVIKVCERLSGMTAKVVYLPGLYLKIGILWRVDYSLGSALGRFFRLFEFTWNISDRLQLEEYLGDRIETPYLLLDGPRGKVGTVRIPNGFVSQVNWTFERKSLESYLQEFFCATLSPSYGL